MKQSDHLELVNAGTLARPGPIGRLVRLLIGAACLSTVAQLFEHWSSTAGAPLSTVDERLLMLLLPLCIFNYVVNIGFGRSWGHRPLILSLAALGGAALVAYATSGSLDSPIVGIPLNLWLGYFYAHLGLSFVLSAAMATPGCEMRAIAELLGWIRGAPADEHACPASLIQGLDSWEQRRRATR